MLLLQHAQDALLSWIQTTKETSDTVPAWPDFDSALTPEILEDSGKFADLPLLLLADLDARERLGGDMDAFQGDQDELASLIVTTFVQKTSNLVMDRDQSGAPVKRQTPSVFLPLLLPRFKEKLHPSIFREFRGSAHLLHEQGLQQWQQWDSDETQAPIRAELQVLLAPEILSASPEDVKVLVSSSWIRAFQRLAKIVGGLPSELTQRGHPTWNLCCASLNLSIASIRSEVDLSLGDYPPSIRFLERHRRAVVGGVTGFFVCATLSLSAYYAFLPSLTQRQQHSMAGVADSMYSMGKYEKARDQYLELIERIRDERFLSSYYFKLGKSEFHLEHYKVARGYFEKAVALDEAAVKETPGARRSHTMLWNLAQLQRLTGDEALAVETLQTIIELFGETDPKLIEQSLRAIDLIQSPNRTLQETINETQS